MLWVKPRFSINNKLLLSFSGAFLLGVCILHLIPELYQDYTPSIGLFILLGFILQLILEFASKGIEHGHSHHHKWNKFPYAIFISLCAHSLIEGMSLTHDHHGHVNHPLLLGIIIHKIPISMVLTSMLVATNIKKTSVYYGLGFFSLSAPLGLFLANKIGESIVENTSFLLAITVGIFLHISTTILFETTEDHKFHLKKFGIIILGLLIAVFTL